MAIRSMMGVTWSPKDRGCSSLSHSVALNLSNRPQEVGQGPPGTSPFQATPCLCCPSSLVSSY